MEIKPDPGLVAEETSAEEYVLEDSESSLIDADDAEQIVAENAGEVIVTSFAAGIVDEVNAVSAEVLQVNDASGQSVVSENIPNEEAVPEESMSTLPEHLERLIHRSSAMWICATIWHRTALRNPLC